MSQNYQNGDFLVFQIESAYGVLRILEIEDNAAETIWHLSAYNEMFLDIDAADNAIQNNNLTISLPHLALTNRAFESTQTARMLNRELTTSELAPLNIWNKSENKQVSDRSVRLLLGIR